MYLCASLLHHSLSFLIACLSSQYISLGVRYMKRMRPKADAKIFSRKKISYFAIPSFEKKFGRFGIFFLSCCYRSLNGEHDMELRVMCAFLLAFLHESKILRYNEKYQFELAIIPLMKVVVSQPQRLERTFFFFQIRDNWIQFNNSKNITYNYSFFCFVSSFNGVQS